MCLKEKGCLASRGNFSSLASEEVECRNRTNANYTSTLSLHCLRHLLCFCSCNHYKSNTSVQCDQTIGFCRWHRVSRRPHFPPVEPESLWNKRANVTAESPLAFRGQKLAKNPPVLFRPLSLSLFRSNGGKDGLTWATLAALPTLLRREKFHRWTSSVRRTNDETCAWPSRWNFNFEATSQPPAPSKKVQYGPTNINKAL